MALEEILKPLAMEFLVHTWNLMRATGQVAVPGLVWPECAVPENANDRIRLLAIFGSRSTGC
jgi:hypothetical protein